ncbi:hypothetical protein GCM10009818_17080 [Nakamurella flavida]
MRLSLVCDAHGAIATEGDSRPQARMSPSRLLARGGSADPGPGERARVGQRAGGVAGMPKSEATAGLRLFQMKPS